MWISVADESDFNEVMQHQSFDEKTLTARFHPPPTDFHEHKPLWN